MTGYASAPAGTGLQKVYDSCGAILEVDEHTQEVVDAEFTVVTGVANRFLRSLVVGAIVPRDMDDVIARLRRSYLAPSSGAMVVALRSAMDRYRAYLQEGGG